MNNHGALDGHSVVCGICSTEYSYHHHWHWQWEPAAGWREWLAGPLDTTKFSLEFQWMWRTRTSYAIYRSKVLRKRTIFSGSRIDETFRFLSAKSLENRMQIFSRRYGDHETFPSSWLTSSICKGHATNINPLWCVTKVILSMPYQSAIVLCMKSRIPLLGLRCRVPRRAYDVRTTNEHSIKLMIYIDWEWNAVCLCGA